jgi:hypothetical protein
VSLCPFRSTHSLYTKKAVKCADPSDRKVKRLLRKLLQRQRSKTRRTMWLIPHDNLPVMAEVGSCPVFLQYDDVSCVKGPIIHQ